MSFLPREIWYEAAQQVERNATRYFALLRWLLWAPSRPDSGWRPHIDGLRAVSVLAVLFYHANFLKVPGGFVGVDVFFVISGFLISRIIYDDIAAHGKFKIVRFYERRARRILPTFVVVTAGTVIAGFFLFLPLEFASLGRSVAYACGFAANIYFYLTSGYFAGTSSTMPLLHYWSLGVEEQFYIVFPLVVLAITKFYPRLLVGTILLIAAISLVSAQYYAINAPEAAFYLAPQRAWELMAGSILALSTWPAVKQRWACEIFAGIGLALILIAVATYSDATPFPGITAAVPVFGAMSILWACEGKATFVGAALSVRPLRYIGLWSYSIYMIHWPLIVFVREAWPQAGPRSAGVVVLAAVALGAASYFIVETPFRQPRPVLNGPKLFAASCASLLILILSGLSISFSQGFQSRMPKQIQQILAYDKPDFISLYRNGTCFLGSSDLRWANLQPGCLPKGHPSALLWGDSHAAQFYTALKARFPTLLIQQANMSSCAPILSYTTPYSRNCSEFNDSVFHWLLTNRPDAIILSALWPTDSDSLSRLDHTVKELRAAQFAVTIIGETPRYPQKVPEILARRLLRGDHDNRAGNDSMGASSNGDNLMKRRYSGIDGVRYLSFVDMVCADRSCPLTTASGAPVDFDADHFTPEGAQWAVKRLFRQGLLLNARR